MLEGNRVHLTEEEVAARLPHKGNSRFLGEATVEPGISATATLREIPILTKSGQKTVPWFVIVDAMAQTIILVKPQEGKTIGVLAGMSEIFVGRPARVGEVVKLTADRIRKRPTFGKAHVIARAGGEILMDGEMSFGLMPADSTH